MSTETRSIAISLRSVEILEAARRRDEHLRVARGLRLGAERHSAVDGNGADAARAADLLERLGHLRSELARGHEHERLDAGRVRVEPLDDRDREGEGLAGAGRALREDVAAAERLGDRGGLDGERAS